VQCHGMAARRHVTLPSFAVPDGATLLPIYEDDVRPVAVNQATFMTFDHNSRHTRCSKVHAPPRSVAIMRIAYRSETGKLFAASASKFLPTFCRELECCLSSYIRVQRMDGRISAPIRNPPFHFRPTTEILRPRSPSVRPQVVHRGMVPHSAPRWWQGATSFTTATHSARLALAMRATGVEPAPEMSRSRIINPAHYRSATPAATLSIDRLLIAPIAD
jgi:hypothetical protein